MTRTASALFLGTALALAALTAPVTAAAQAQPAIVYGQTHAEAALTEALARHIPVGKMRLELDSRAVELRAPAGAAVEGGLRVENLYYSPVQARFAAELVIPGTAPAVRLPVAGRAYGTVEVPVLVRRVAPGDLITAADVDWVEVRADQAGSDTAASDAQIVGMTPKRGVPVNQPVRLRDVQSPRIIDKGAVVTITLETPVLTLATQGKALQEGGRGDTIRVLNTQSNRIVEATVAGPNLVAVAKPGATVLK
ncbi:flagellar basal body P-ring formation chaperone FlgA [Azospirillum sp.]|uniref:flagellar basal body P-ring formation chaperone FlgA n=1 Tax=Azospirillum sp. TaxID=34012 RepID=UPI002D541365|nr:flagellar basal body P-ring formation chaperone FlgA [Azospirillum sp.]HYD70012.1 flagellar basal body P-ring formation chaperone FlgA [Azospirillum sp.]